VQLPPFVPGGVPGQPVSEPPEDEASQEPYFLFVGRLEKLKGLQTLIPVFRRYPGARLLIAGAGNYESTLKAAAACAGNIRFLGHLPREQLQSLYRRALALIVPSICYEAFPLVAIEAFRERTPVIVRNLGGMPQVVSESGGGFIYNTEEDLVRAMDKISQDPASRRELGLKGYNAYRENWTPEAHLERYFSLIDKLASTRAAPGQRLRTESSSLENPAESAMPTSDLA
jgi:glycosyltransferase involved in cell wall biosynthesis